MITRQFQEKIERFQHLLQENEVDEFITFVRLAASQNNIVMGAEHLSKQSSSDFWNFTVNEFAKSGQTILNHGNVISIIYGSGKLRHFLLLEGQWLNSRDPKISLLEKLSLLQESINQFFKNNSDRIIIFNLINASQDFVDFIDGILAGLESTVNILQSERRQAPENQADLSIFLENGTGIYSQFLEKLQSIQVLYSEICQLLGVSEQEYPLRIVKIESGSLWTKVFGESKTIELLTRCAENSFDFLYRNYTREGQIASIPRQVGVLESTIQLAALLEEKGYDVSAMKEPIQKSGQIIAANLQELLQGQGKVQLNDKEYIVGPSRQTESFLEGKEQAQLSPASEPDPEEPTMEEEVVE
jgi:hypothetical protein